MQRYTKLHWLVRNRSRLPSDVLKDGGIFLVNPEKAMRKAIKEGASANTALGRAMVQALGFTCTNRLATSLGGADADDAKLDETGEINAQKARMIGKS